VGSVAAGHRQRVRGLQSQLARGGPGPVKNQGRQTTKFTLLQPQPCFLASILASGSLCSGAIVSCTLAEDLAISKQQQ
jgi:hypothetical protein